MMWCRPPAVRAAAGGRAWRRGEGRGDTVRRILTYAHFALIGGVICAAAGVAEAVAEPARHVHPDVAALLFGGCAAYLATFGYTDRRMSRRRSFARPAGAGVLLVMLPAVPAVPALAALGALTVVIVAVNVLEFAGGRAPVSAPAGSAERGGGEEPQRDGGAAEPDRPSFEQ